MPRRVRHAQRHVCAISGARSAPYALAGTTSAAKFSAPLTTILPGEIVPGWMSPSVGRAASGETAGLAMVSGRAGNPAGCWGGAEAVLPVSPAGAVSFGRLTPPEMSAGLAGLKA